MNFDSEAIARATGGRHLAPAGPGPIQTDTRTLVEGAWFLAIVGPRFDGHRFLDQAAETGAIGCVVSRPPAGWSGGAVLVGDTVTALQDLGRAARARLHGAVVGLTGSAGKTTTRALVGLALTPAGTVHQSRGNLNNHLGVPMTLLAAPESADATVVEMGTSAPGEIALLADIAVPDVRLIVNVGPSHLLELGGIEGVAREKGALFASARAGDVLCVNLDDPRVAALPRPAGTRVIAWGRHPDADIRLLEALVDPRALTTRARVRTPRGEVDLELPAPGEHLAHNAAGALAVAHALDLDPAASVAAMQAYEPVGMRLRTESLPGGAVAINDAYNANPSSMAASLHMLAGLAGRRAAVLSDMLELGTGEAEFHHQVAALAASLDLDLVVLVGPKMSAAAASCPGCWAAEDGMELVEQLREWLQPGDRVLFKGSRGARVERIVHALQEGTA